MRRDVAGGTGIGVVVPDAADPLAPLQEPDVVIAGAVEHPPRTDPAEATPDDGDRRRPAPRTSVSVRRLGRSHAAETTTPRLTPSPRRQGTGRSRPRAARSPPGRCRSAHPTPS